jgi:hypothetical protein
VPLAQDGLGDLRPGLPLGGSRPEPLRDARVHPVDGLAGLAQRPHFGRRLADPQRGQHLAGQVLRGAGEDPGELQDVQRPHPVGQRH